MTSKTSEFESRSPVARIETGEFSRVIDATGRFFQFQAVHFTFTLHWLRHSGAKSVVIHRRSGEVIKEGSEYNDHYGLMDPFFTAMSDADRLARKYGATGPDADVFVQALGTVRDVPVSAIKRPAVFGGSFKVWEHIPDDWYRRDDEALAAWIAAISTPGFSNFDERTATRAKLSEVKSVMVAREEVIWSSDQVGEEARAATLKAFAAKIFDGLDLADHPVQKTHRDEIKADPVLALKKILSQATA